MKVSVLMYHDVPVHGQLDASGFPGAGPARYKVDRQAFVAQLDAVAAAVGTPPLGVESLVCGDRPSGALGVTLD